MTQFLILVALALAPIVFIFNYVYVMDKYQREPLPRLIISFLLGAATCFPVVWIGDFLSALMGWIYPPIGDPIALFLYVFFVIACVEEGMKYLVLYGYNYHSKDFDEPYDGIMYGVAVGLGFAALENLLYVFNKGGVPTGIVRMFSAVPAHGAFGTLMGYYMGMAKFVPSKSKRNLWLFIAFISATLLHALYDYFLFIDYGDGVLALISFILLGLGIRFGLRSIRIFREKSPFKTPSSPATPPQIVEIEQNDAENSPPEV